MWRSLPICWLVAELLLAPAALAGSRPTCEQNCAAMKKKFDKACKKSFNGSCAGRGKALVDDLDKKCYEDCAKRKKK